MYTCIHVSIYLFVYTIFKVPCLCIYQLILTRIVVYVYVNIYMYMYCICGNISTLLSKKKVSSEDIRPLSKLGFSVYEDNNNSDNNSSDSEASKERCPTSSILMFFNQQIIIAVNNVDDLIIYQYIIMFTRTRVCKIM